MNNEMRASLDDIDDSLTEIATRIAAAAWKADEEAGDLWCAAEDTNEAGVKSLFEDADRTQKCLHDCKYALENALRHYRRAMKCKR